MEEAETTLEDLFEMGKVEHQWTKVDRAAGALIGTLCFLLLFCFPAIIWAVYRWAF